MSVRTGKCMIFLQRHGQSRRALPCVLPSPRSVGRGGRVVVGCNEQLSIRPFFSDDEYASRWRDQRKDRRALAARFADVARDRKSLFFFPFS